MKFVFLLGLWLASACVPQVAELKVAKPPLIANDSEMETVKLILPNLGPAPELQNETWLNTDQPLHLADLRGSVVLIDMWTFR